LPPSPAPEDWAVELKDVWDVGIGSGESVIILATGKKYPNIWGKNRDNTGIIQG